jgi:hypothetical protein
LMAAPATTVHASAVLVGARAVVIRGPSGSGKSRLALALIEAGRSGRLLFARLVGDDRIFLAAAGGRLLARPADNLTGLIEVRGAGLLRLDYEPGAVVGLVLDLAAIPPKFAASACRGLRSQPKPRPCPASSRASTQLTTSGYRAFKHRWPAKRPGDLCPSWNLVTITIVHLLLLRKLRPAVRYGGAVPKTRV